MLKHQVLNGIFNETSCNPSKQLAAVRKDIIRSTYEPLYTIILPPRHLIMKFIDADTFFSDNYLLSHVARSTSQKLVALNGNEWEYRVTESRIIPEKGFSRELTNEVKITKAYLWQPGLESLNYDATFTVLETDDILLHADIVKKSSWFNSKRSMPLYLENPYLHLETKNELANSPRAPKSASDQLPTKAKNPAQLIGKTKLQNEQSMAKLDYTLACMQFDVVSSEELAERYARVINDVKSFFTKAGGIIIEQDSLNTRDLPQNAISVLQLYDYAEFRLGRTILKTLDKLLPLETKKKMNHTQFRQIHDDLKNLDITQVDIPNVDLASIPKFERAVTNASLILNRLTESRDSKSMCSVLLQAIKELSNPDLGTVSADTLIGLVMLSFIRCSTETAEILERDLFYVSHFSPLVTLNTSENADFGHISYTLMVVESVVMQLRMEHTRLLAASKLNEKIWLSISNVDTSKLLEVYQMDKTALLSRKDGKSVLLQAAEQQNPAMISFLLENFGELDLNFLLNDKDNDENTVLMAALRNAESVAVLARKIGDSMHYYQQKNLRGNNIGHLLSFLDAPQPIIALIGHLVPWNSANNNGESPLIYFAKAGKLDLVVQFCSNFFDHFDRKKNSLMHYAVSKASSDSQVVDQLASLDTVDLNATNNDLQTALSIANDEQNTQMVTKLLQLGANPWYVNSQALHMKIRQAREPRICYVDSPTLSNPNSTSASTPNSNSDPSMRITFKTQEYIKPLTEIVSFKRKIEQSYPASWIPPLFLPPTLTHTALETIFTNALKADLDTALTAFLYQVQTHGSLKSTLEPFLESKCEFMPQRSPPKGDESIESITMFLDYSCSQLDRSKAALCNFVRKISNLQTTYSLFDSYLTRLVAETALFSSKIIKPTSAFYQQYPPKQFNRRLNLQFCFLAKYTASLSLKLREPTKIIQAYKDTSQLLVEMQLKLDTLNNQKPKPAWLGSLEEKRVAEIKDTETQVLVLGSKKMELYDQLRNTHFHLATELSAFNESHEKCILRNLSSYALMNISREKEQLSMLQNGIRK